MSKLRVSYEQDLDTAVKAGLDAIRDLNKRVNVPGVPEVAETYLLEQGYAALTAVLLEEAPSLPDRLATIPAVAKVFETLKGYGGTLKVEVVE